MADASTTPRQAPAAAAGDGAPRRDFLARLSTAAMAGGLAAGYGTLGVLAGRFLYPSQAATAWLFVCRVEDIPAGGSWEFESPSGLKVVVQRKGSSAPAAPRSDDFIALSSICPHLGCRVHWEAANDRFFCPCHNGEFDPQGNPTGGPVLAAGQRLPRYPLKLDGGKLFIELPSALPATPPRQDRHAACPATAAGGEDVRCA